MQHAVCRSILEAFDQTVREILCLNRGHEARAGDLPQRRCREYLQPPTAPTGDCAFRHAQRLNHLGGGGTQLCTPDGHQQHHQSQVDASSQETNGS